MKTELKKNVYKIIENGEHINSLDATERIVKIADDYSTKKMINFLNNVLDTYLLDHISIKALENKREELYNLKNRKDV
tara:strand:+ start:258 stop:491 length:234 start_codon:yes stop_codon:yes gene_type:complete